MALFVSSIRRTLLPIVSNTKLYTTENLKIVDINKKQYENIIYNYNLKYKTTSSSSSTYTNSNSNNKDNGTNDSKSSLFEYIMNMLSKFSLLISKFKKINITILHKPTYLSMITSYLLISPLYADSQSLPVSTSLQPGESPKLVFESSVTLPLTFKEAPIILRLAALLLDSIVQISVGALLALPLNFLLGKAYTAGLLFILLPYIYDLFFYLYRDTETPGKSVCNLKIVNYNNGNVPSWKDIVIRRFGFCLNGVFGIDFLWGILHPSHRCLHDYLAGTQVVSV